MVKRILFLVPLFLCLTFSTASAENWVIFNYANGVSTYLDTDRLIQKGDTATVWMHLVDNSGYHVYSKHQLFRYSHSATTLYILLPSKDGKPGRLERLNSKVTPILPDSTIEKVYNIIWPNTN